MTAQLARFRRVLDLTGLGQLLPVAETTSGALSSTGFGAELVTNGDFSGGSTGWTANGQPYSGVTISGGQATCSGAAQILTQNVGFVTGQQYRVQIKEACTTNGQDIRLTNDTVNGTNIVGIHSIIAVDSVVRILNYDFIAVGPYLTLEAGGAVLSGNIYTVSARRIIAAASHDTSGAIIGPGSAIAGAAVYNALHPTSGTLVGPGSTVAATAARTREHATSGILAGPGTTLAGVAVYNAKHDTSGTLTGPGSTIVGSAARTRQHDTSGILTGAGSTIVGTAVYNAKHGTTGTLTGPGSALAGSATRFHAFATSGVLVGPGSTVAGSADRLSGTSSHVTSGALVGQSSILVGIATRTRVHATSGILTGPVSIIAGRNAARWRDHASSGVLLGVVSVVFGRGFNGTPQLQDVPVDSDNLVNEPSPPPEDLGPIAEPIGQIVNHPPYPAA